MARTYKREKRWGPLKSKKSKTKSKKGSFPKETKFYEDFGDGLESFEKFKDRRNSGF